MATTSLVDVGGGFEAAFYAVFVIYLLGMLLLAIRGFFLKRTAKTEGGVEAEMNYHFLAGSNFGPMILFLNFCAQYIGGIVMVATPDFSRQLGMIQLFWISGCSWCGWTFNVVSARVREIMRGRNYLSPNDYLTDRYRSTFISALGVLASTFQMIMITGLEWKSLAEVLKAILGAETETDSWVWLLGMFVFMCECLGGMASVALTDAIQAGLLLFSFLAMPCFCQHIWGGFSGVGGMECQNLQVADAFGYNDSLASPWPILSTDLCYMNVKEDVSNECATDLGGIAAPNSFLAAVGVDIPAYKMVDHEFGKPSEYKKSLGARYQEVCSVQAMCDGVACTTKACPPAGTKYTASAVAMLNTSHSALMVTCDEDGKVCTYNHTTITPDISDNSTWPDYHGMLVTYDGTAAYTNEKMSSSKKGCVGINTLTFWHYKYPPLELVLLMFSFGFSWIPFAMAPLTLHRTMTARDADSLRYGLAMLHSFPVSFFIPVILLGYTAGAIFPEDTTSAFPLMAFKIAQYSGFGGFVMTICLVACMASFMSTADSIVICGSLLFTVDMYYTLIRKGKAAINELMILTKFMSFFMISCGISIALYSGLDFIEMLNIGNGILGVLVPVYLGMFFPQLQSLEVAVAMVINVIVVITFQMMRMFPAGDCGGTCEAQGNPYGGTSRHSPALVAPMGDGNPDEAFLWLLPAFWGMVICVPCLFILHVVFKSFPALQEAFDKVQAVPVVCMGKFGKQRMDLDREGTIVKALMEGVMEPVTNPDPICRVAILMPLMSVFALPWPSYGHDDWAPQVDVAGMPKWAFNFMIVNLFGTISLIVVCVFFWKGKPDVLSVTGDATRKQSFGVPTSWGKNSIQVMPAAAMTQVMPAPQPPGVISIQDLDDDMCT